MDFQELFPAIAAIFLALSKLKKGFPLLSGLGHPNLKTNQNSTYKWNTE